MATPRTARRHHRVHSDGSPRDGGFILVTLGLLIIPIIAFTALAVDVSSWYSRATELQRAADSAALAGVIWMPDLGQAQTEATKILAQNNVVSGTNDLTASIEQGSELNSLKVCITDHSAPQYFSSLFSTPETLTRCGTAMYNLPLELGSPLNYYGGNASANLGYAPGTPPANAIPQVPALSAFGTNNYCYVSNGSGVVGYWYRNGSTDPANWSFIWGYNSTTRNCNTPPPDVPDYASFSGNRICQVMSGGSAMGYWDNRGYSGSSNWRFYLGAYPGRPICGWNGTSNGNPIPASKSPNFWAAIAGPGMFAPNGDARAPRCKSSGDCSTTDNTMYRPDGYTYSLDVPPGTTAGDVSVQIFDAAVSQTSGTAPTGDTRYGGSYIQHTRFTLMDSGPTPYDTGDDTLVPGCSLTTQGPSATYNKLWVELCSFTPVVGRRYYLNVRSTEPTPNGTPPWGQYGNTYNGYALRAVAGSYPAACLSPTFPQLNSTACYGVDPQPRLSGYTDMEMYNGIPSGVPTQFFIANVKNEYKGKTLVIELWDPGDMVCNNKPCGNQSYITVMAPGSSVNGTPQLGCSWASSTPTGTNTDSGIIGSSSPCKVQTTTDDNNKFQNQWLQVKINLPADYSCNESVNPTTTGGSCWWQIKYETVNGSLNDYTTWTARIEGDPVRLIQ